MISPLIMSAGPRRGHEADPPNPLGEFAFLARGSCLKMTALGVKACGHQRRLALTGGIIYGMEKTTVYLPEDLKAAIRCAAQRQGLSEAEVIRRSIRKAVADERPRPRGGVFAGNEPIARRTDELLQGFGER